MAQLMDLPFEILHAILIALVMSSGGARDLARVSATCKKLMKVAQQSDVLRVVNLKRLSLTNDFTPHHHRNDLLCQCARAGNPVAESILGKALLTKDIWFWNMIYYNPPPPLTGNEPSNGVLRHDKLVRSFIRYGSSKEIAKMRVPFLCYINMFLGEDMDRTYDMLCAISRLCSYETLQHGNPVENVRSSVSLRAIKNLLAELRPPPGLTHREVVLGMFDKLFPSALV